MTPERVASQGDITAEIARIAAQYQGGGDPGPPFFALTVFARGLLNRLFTRADLPGAASPPDPLLATAGAERRSTLVCVAEDDGAAYRFDIHLQGPAETVFLAYSQGAR